MTDQELRGCNLPDRDRPRLAAAHMLWECRAYLLTHCREHPQAIRLASALAHAVDLIWPQPSPQLEQARAEVARRERQRKAATPPAADAAPEVKP